MESINQDSGISHCIVDNATYTTRLVDQKKIDDTLKLSICFDGKPIQWLRQRKLTVLRSKLMYQGICKWACPHYTCIYCTHIHEWHQLIDLVTGQVRQCALACHGWFCHHFMHFFNTMYTCSTTNHIWLHGLYPSMDLSIIVMQCMNTYNIAPCMYMSRNPM